MGMEFSVYVGCYIEFPQGKVEVKKYCLESPKTNERFDISGDVKFCPKTGVELKRVEEVYEEFLDPCPYIEDDVFGSDGNLLQEDAFTIAESLRGVFLPNGKGYGVSSYGDELTKDLSGLDIKSEINNFKEEYKDYLGYYREKYGEFQVKFGVVGYWS